MSNTTIVINGKVYDALTGLPVAAPMKKSTPVASPAQPKAMTPAPVAAASHKASHAKSIHSKTQKSVTLRRDILKKPAAPAHTGEMRRKPTAGHIAKSPQIHKFAPHPQPLKSFDVSAPKKAAAPKVASIVHVTHTAVTSKTAHAVPSPAPKLSSSHLKKQLLAEAHAAPVQAPERPVKTKKRLLSKKPRMASLAVASLAVMVLGGYFTYLNMPSLSVRVAAAQADVAATFPDYHPDGYRFSGPVAYTPGQVAIKFQSNGSDLAYTVTQQKSTWDSTAVYDNLISRVADNSYVTNSQQGLTIYTFKNKAAWVNRGILYTIDGNAPLSNEQLLRIAGSM